MGKSDYIGENMKKFFIIIFILLLIVLCLLFIVEKNKPVEIVENAKNKQIVQNEKSAGIKITFLDVGQGDASFIEFPDGEQMLVDCAIDARILAKLGQIMPYYDRDIDYLVITHPDSDHYGGCIDVLDRFEVKNIVYNGLQKENDGFWKEFWRRVQSENANYIEINQEQTWSIASSSIHWLFPDKEAGELPDSLKKKDNNTSLIFKLSSQNHSVLFAADAENELEQYLLNKYKDELDSDILKVAHHGSSGSSGRLFVEAVSPAYAVISVGKDNKFGHPSLRVLKKLERAGSQIFRTDENGDVVVEISNGVVEVYFL